MNNNKNLDTKVFALGGLGEVGKNMYCVMHGDEIIILDSGVLFPPSDILGVDYIIPDFTFLKENEKKIKALVITHGHEDHIGGIPFLLMGLNIPYIYAPNQASHLIRKKLSERKINYKNMIVYDENTHIKFANMNVEFFRVTHSIPDAHGIVVNTPNGSIVFTGDFKFDLTPIGPVADFAKIGEIGKRGVALLLSDSTNAQNEGFSTSESKVDAALGDIFARTNSRIIVATFASNIYRLKHIVDTCRKNGRKIAIFGRSMENNMTISIEGGYITGKDIFVKPEEALKLPPEKVCFLCTGSQGEPLAALSRIAAGTHRQIRVTSDDTVIFSSSPIPGNAFSISRTINELYLKGVKVYTNTSLSDVHTSGHASSEELKLMIRLLKPKNFMPAHGEYRMLKAHADLGVSCDIPRENTFVLSNGDVVNINNGVASRGGRVQASDVYVEGNRIGETTSAIMRDRKAMANDGVVVVNANINNGKLIGNSIITSRGFVLVSENIPLLKSLEKVTTEAIANKINSGANVNEVKMEISTVLSGYIFKELGRRPVIYPIIMNVNK